MVWIAVLGFWGGMVGSFAYYFGWLGLIPSRAESLAEERLAIGWACAAALLWLSQGRTEP